MSRLGEEINRIEVTTTLDSDIDFKTYSKIKHVFLAWGPLHMYSLDSGEVEVATTILKIRLREFMNALYKESGIMPWARKRGDMIYLTMKGDEMK